MPEPTNNNEVVQTVDSEQKVEQVVDKQSTPQFDMSSIQEMIRKVVEDTIKSQLVSNTTTVKPQNIKSETDIDAMLERRMQQMEQKMFINSLKQNEIDELKKVPEYESLKPSQLKAILGLKSLPNVETSTPKVEGGTLNDYINKARGK